MTTEEKIEFLHGCGGLYIFSHQDDIGTKWYKCNQCGESKTYEQLIKNSEEFKEKLRIQKAELEREASLEEVTNILSETIKFDDNVKQIVFLALLTAFTEEDQINLVMQGESSSGKTYTIKEILNFFPKNSWIEKHGVSPTAFFYDENRILVDKRNLEPIVFLNLKELNDYEKIEYKEKLRNAVMMQDFYRKIIWLPDMPRVEVLEKLRSVLSHDRQICEYTSTTMAVRGGFKAKTVLVKGYGVFLICSLAPYLDEQEITRCFIINPSWSKEKEDAAMQVLDKRASDPYFTEHLERDPKRIWLKNRIQAIKEANIKKIVIDQTLLNKVNEWFKTKRKSCNPKNIREYSRFHSLIKAWALFNFWNRKRDENNNIWANETDFEVAKRVYETIVEASSFNLAPEQYEFYKVVKEIYGESNPGLKVMDFFNIYYEKYGRTISDKRLRATLKAFTREGLMLEQKEGNAFKYYFAGKEQNSKEESIEEFVQ